MADDLRETPGVVPEDVGIDFPAELRRVAAGMLAMTLPGSDTAFDAETVLRAADAMAALMARLDARVHIDAADRGEARRDSEFEAQRYGDERWT